MSDFVCLMYHDVCQPELTGPDGPFASLSPSIRSYSVTTTQLDEQLSALAQQAAAVGCSPWVDPLDLLEGAIAPAQGPQVLLTFDDGWAGSFDAAGPILARHGARAIVFVTTGLIGHGLFASAARLRESPTEQFEIGAHTVTHPFLAECATAQIRRELTDSRNRLEDILGRPVESMSVPNGSIDDRVRQIAQEAGYRFVFTSEVRRNSRAGSTFEVGRIAVRSETRTQSLLDWARGDIASATWRRKALGIPKRLLGPQRYRQLRSWALGEMEVDEEMSDLVRRHQRSTASTVSPAQELLASPIG